MYLTFNYVVIEGTDLGAEWAGTSAPATKTYISPDDDEKACRHHDGTWIYLILLSKSEAEVSS